MPYKLDGNTVVYADTGKPVPGGKHDTKEQALAHLRALEANVSDANKHMKVGARNSSKDAERLQQIHDLAVMNGAECESMEGKSVVIDRAEKMMLMEENQYAMREGYDIQSASQALSQLAYLAIGETEPREINQLKKVCALMRGLCDFIMAEINEMESAMSEPGMTNKSAKSQIAIPNYIKSLHLSLDEQRFKDVLAVKFIGKNEIRGYSNLWGNPETVDLDTEFFTKSTDFWDKVLGLPRPLTWNHAQDKSTFKGSAVVGEISEFGDDTVGRFYAAVLDRSHQYKEAVSKLISDRVLGTSSDSAPQYVEREKQKNGSVWLKTWPLFAAALTDVPCEPRMLDIGSPYWKTMGVDAKLLQDRIAEAGYREIPREEIERKLAETQRKSRELGLYTV